MRERTAAIFSFVTAAALLGLLFAAATFAEDPNAQATANMDASAVGKVVALDTSSRSVTVETGMGPVIYRTDDASQFRKAGHTSELAALKVGDEVTVNYKGSANNPIITTLEVTGSATASNARNENLTAENRLPRTGSSLPLLGLAGVLLLGGALALRTGLRWLH